MFRVMRMAGLFGLAVVSLASDWPQFNGPNRNGVSGETGLADAWPEEGPTQLWEVPVGPGFGGAVVQDGKVFFTDRLDDQKDLVRCVALKTGKALWQMEQDMPGRLPYNGSRCTPTVDGSQLFAVSPFGHLYAVSTETGELQWKQHFAQTFNGDPPYFGYSHSPLVVGENVIIAPMTEEASLAAYNRHTGDLVWRSKGTSGEAYTSPFLMEVLGKPQIILLDVEGLKGFDPARGYELWRYEGYKNRVPIPHPTVLPGQQLFLSGGYGGGSVLLQLKPKGSTVEVSELFRLQKRGSQIQQVLFYRNHLYANFNTNENLQAKEPEGLLCLSLDGKAAWETKNAPDLNRGNILIADGKLFALGGEDGVLHMFEASFRGCRKLASAKIFKAQNKDNMIWAPMALADGKLVLRDQNVMKCLNLR